eukprot:TRINITY_DN2767_c2_g1_i2.p1 TRINITY_DN2767_c2_g1~~TRINITY_DN2767_c2_g1_i2.p1  ORF type:complete len:942 (-),score=292.73 TRINITY_DN2767_c2_g1_i2:45-2669(-)
MSTGEDKTMPLPDLVQKIIGEGGIMLNVTELSKIAQANDSDPDFQQLRQSLFLTLYFLTLFLSYEEVSPTLKAAINRWIESYSMEKAGGRTNDFTDELLRMLNPAYLESSDFLLNIVEQCSVIDLPPPDWPFGGSSSSSSSSSSATSPGLTGAASITPSDSFDTKTISRSLIHSYLTKILCSPTKEKKHKAILDSILLFLKHPLLPENRMLTLLQMLKHFIIICPSIHPSTLSQALTLVKNYYLWPRPYGDFAREVLPVLTMEAKSPGSVMRALIFQETPSLAPKNAPPVPTTGRERVAYVIADLQYAEARVVHDLLKMGSLPDPGSPSQLQVDLLGNMLGRILGVDPELLGLEFCSAEHIQMYYEQALEAMDQAMTMNEKDARVHRTTRFTAIKDGLAKCVRATAEFEPPHIPRLPPLLLQVVGLKCANTKPRKGDEYYDNNLKYVLRKQCYQTLLGIVTPYTKMPSPKGHKHVVRIGIVGGDSTIHHLTSAHVCLRREHPQFFTAVEIRYFFLPTSSPSSIFATFLARGDRWYCRNILHGLRPFLYIAPSLAGPPAPTPEAGATSPLSKSGSVGRAKGAIMLDMTGPSMAQQDVISSLRTLQAARTMGTNSFYRTSDGSEPLSADALPKKSASAGSMFQGSQTVAQTERDLPLSPGGVLKQEIDGFFREASWKLRMKVFQCECWAVLGEELHYYTIPFCLRVEIGMNAYARGFLEANELPTTLSLSEIQQHKAFKFPPPALSMKHIPMNVLGVARPAQTLDCRQYSSVVISNVGQTGDKMVANPTRPWVEVYTMDNDSKKKKAKDEGQGHSYHASLIEFETDDRKRQVDILVDGELYGPFHRIRVSACAVPDDPGEILELPIMSYLPLLDLV